MRKLTVTANTPLSLNDWLGTEVFTLAGSPFVSLNFDTAGQSKSCILSETQWDRVRPMLEDLSARGVRVSDAYGVRYRPMISYVAERMPGQRPHLTKIHNVVSAVAVAGVDLTSATNTLTISGSNLIPGIAAIGDAVGGGRMRITAQHKGPSGNGIIVNLKASTSAAISSTVSVAITEYGQVVTINVTPNSSAVTATAIAAHLNSGAVAANKYVSATVLTAGSLAVQSVRLSGGEGAGVASHTFVNGSGDALIIEAAKPGNQGNLIAVKLIATSLGGSVAYGSDGETILISPVTASNTIDDLVIFINANSFAKGKIRASGGGATAPGVTDAVFLHGGAGEDAVLKIGPTTATILAHSDTSITAVVDGTAISAVSTDTLPVTLLTDFGVVALAVPANPLGAVPGGHRESVAFCQTNVAAGDNAAFASSTPVRINWAGAAAAVVGWVAPRAGSLTALSAALSTAAVGSDLRIGVYKNGTIMNALTVIDLSDGGGASNYNTFVAGTYTFVAGDVIDVRIQTSSAWSATTADLGVTVEVTT